MITAFTLALSIGTLLGLLAAVARNTWRDALISVATLVCYATPGFWLGLMLIVIFSLSRRPTSGFENIAEGYEGWERAVDVARHLAMPATALGLFYLALYTRVMRASMLEQTGMDYVVTARPGASNAASCSATCCATPSCPC